MRGKIKKILNRKMSKPKKHPLESDEDNPLEIDNPSLDDGVIITPDASIPIKSDVHAFKTRSKRSNKETYYSEVIADRILERVAAGEDLRKISREDGFPPAHIILSWFLYPDEVERPGFAARFEKATTIGLHMMATEIVSIADDSGHDKVKKMVDGKTIEVVDTEHIARDKLRIDTRKFILQRKLRKEFGDNVQVQHSGTIDLAARLASARGRADLREIPINRNTTLIQGESD